MIIIHEESKAKITLIFIWIITCISPVQELILGASYSDIQLWVSVVSIDQNLINLDFATSMNNLSFL